MSVENLNGDFSSVDETGIDIVEFEGVGKPTDLEDWTALDDSLKSDVTESKTFPDPGDLHYEINPVVEQQTEDEILIEFPNVEEDLENIVSLESALVDLDYVCQDILASGGINQFIATEADKCIEGFLNENRPLGYYTKAPSATNLHYALEAIDTKKAGIFAAIFAAILAALYKIVEWFKEKKKKEKDLAKEAEELSKDLNDLVSRTKKTNDVHGGVENLFKDVAENGGSTTKKLMFQLTGDLADIAKGNRSVLNSKVKSLFSENGGGSGIAKNLQALVAALESLEKIAEKQIVSNLVTDEIEADAAIKKIMEGTHPSVASELGFVNYEGKVTTIIEVANDISKILNELRSTKVEVSNIEDIFEGLASAVKYGLGRDIAIAVKANFETSTKITERIQKLQKIVMSGKVETEDRIKENVNYKGKKHLVDAVNNLARYFLRYTTTLDKCSFIAFNLLKEWTRLLERSLDETKIYLNKIKKEYVDNNQSESHADEIKRIESFLAAIGRKD